MGLTWLLNGAVGLLTGVLSGMGVGGGSLLVVYLTALAGWSHTAAAGTNLLYLLCCAPAALFCHIKNNLIDLKIAGLCLAGGLPAAVAASLLAGGGEQPLLHTLFGVWLLAVGIKEIFARDK